MAFQSVPGAAQVVVRMSVSGETITNTFYGVRVGGYTLGNITDLAAGMDLWVEEQYKSFLSTSLGYNGVEVTGLENINDFQVVNDTNAGVGENASAPLNNSDCFAVARRTSLTGRSARGRVYVPLCVNHLQTNVNFVTTTARDAVTDRLELVRLYMINNGWVECVVSRYSEKMKRPLGVAFSVQQYSATGLRVDSQRGRMPVE